MSIYSILFSFFISEYDNYMELKEKYLAAVEENLEQMKNSMQEKPDHKKPSLANYNKNKFVFNCVKFLSFIIFVYKSVLY